MRPQPRSNYLFRLGAHDLIDRLAVLEDKQGGNAANAELRGDDRIFIDVQFRDLSLQLRAQSIPIVFFFDGVHEDYHRPGDEPQKIDYLKMEKVARTIYVMLWEVANRAARVKVDKQLPAQLQQRAGY